MQHRTVKNAARLALMEQNNQLYDKNCATFHQLISQTRTWKKRHERHERHEREDVGDTVGNTIANTMCMDTVGTATASFRSNGIDCNYEYKQKHKNYNKLLQRMQNTPVPIITISQPIAPLSPPVASFTNTMENERPDEAQKQQITAIIMAKKEDLETMQKQQVTAITMAKKEDLETEGKIGDQSLTTATPKAQVKEMTISEQVNETTTAEEVKEMTTSEIEQVNETTTAEQVNETTTAEQVNEMTTAEQVNDEVEQVNDEVEQVNDEVEKVNEMITAEQDSIEELEKEIAQLELQLSQTDETQEVPSETILLDNSDANQSNQEKVDEFEIMDIESTKDHIKTQIQAQSAQASSWWRWPF